MAKIQCPINYVENNMVRTQDGHYWAYYEMNSYNYSFLSDAEKAAISDTLRGVISETTATEFHLLQIMTEASIQAVQNKGISLITGNLADVAKKRIEAETAVLARLAEKRTGSPNQQEPRCFIGFRLAEASIDKSLKGMLARMEGVFGDFKRSVNTNLMGDYVRVSKRELTRYIRAERFLCKQLANSLDVQRVTPDDLGYIIAHLSGQRGVPYEKYKWHLPAEEHEDEIFVRKYDILSPAGAEIAIRPRHLQVEHETGSSYVAYFTFCKALEELMFPGCEFLYHQQTFPFPIDVSIRAEVVQHAKAMPKLRDKKKSLDDAVSHAYETGNSPTSELEDAVASADEFEQSLSRTKEPMYQASCLFRISAETPEALEERARLVLDHYKTHYAIILRRLFGSMLGAHYECWPGGKVNSEDMRQPVESSFFSSLGFGATDRLGDGQGFFIGYTESESPVYFWPPLAAQSVKGADTSSLSISITGKTGYGKSIAGKSFVTKAVLHGARAVVIDPIKPEWGWWHEMLPELGDEYNVVTIEAAPENEGLLDPYVIMPEDAKAEELARRILTYLMGINMQEDGAKYGTLGRALERVSSQPPGTRGLLHVIDELRNDKTTLGDEMALHLESISKSGTAKLLFSRGDVKKHLSFDKQLNIVQFMGIKLPQKGADPNKYKNDTDVILGVAILHVVAAFTEIFIRSDRETFKIVAFEEAWAILDTQEGESLIDDLSRVARSFNGGLWLMTQTAFDLSQKGLKSSIGQKFAFNPGADMEEVRAVLEYLGLDPDDEAYQRRLQTLPPGVCIYRDLLGELGKLDVELKHTAPNMYRAFDSRPPDAQGILSGVRADE
ncbi:MAG: ATP-binding protein [Oscillospiraceae bacterium]|nr:ATP-binding protein [Oscillospiraceae bacterium]